MTTIVTRAGKGSALTHNEVDSNFTNLNNAKYESGNNATLGTINGTVITASTNFSGNLTGNVTGNADTATSATTATTATTATNQSGGTVSATTGAFSGVASFSDGSAAAPSITNIGDTDTGVFFPAANTTAFSQGGAESMRISSVGWVGIGTDGNSTAPLEVREGTINTVAINSFGEGDAYGQANLLIQADVFNSGVPRLSLQADGDFSTTTIKTTNNFPLILGTNNIERMRIDTSGNVGIGVGTPASSLQVVGAIAGGYGTVNTFNSAIGFATKNVVRKQFSGSQTITTTVPPNGTICVLNIWKSNTTAAVVTFGTGFVSAGTLNTGTDSTKVFNVTFVAANSLLYEVSRTGAL